MNTNISVLLNDMNTYNRNIIKNMAARPSHLLRTALMLLLLFAGGMMTGAWAADYTYTYQVVDLTGGFATQAQVTAAEGGAPAIPDIIKTDLVTAFHYYTADQFDVDGSTYTLKNTATELTNLPAANTTIYVKYEYDNSTSPLDLTGMKVYYIKDTDPNDANNCHYLSFDTQWISASWVVEADIDIDSKRQWKFEGGDPYKIYLKNIFAITYSGLSSSGPYLRSDLAPGKFEDNNNVRFGPQTTDKLFNTYFINTANHIVAANNVYRYENSINKYIYLCKKDKTGYQTTGSRFFKTGSGNLSLNDLHITFEARPVSVNYSLLTMGRKIFISVEGDASQGLELPMLIQSPLVSGYHYYPSTSFTDSNSDGIYEMAGGAEEIDVTTYIPTEGETIYVTYDYDASNAIEFGSNAIHIDLTGKIQYTLNTGTEVSPKYLCWSTTTKRTLVSSNDSYQMSRANGAPSMTMNDFYLWTLGYEDGSTPDPYAIVIKCAMPSSGAIVGGENYVLSPYSGVGSDSDAETWSIPKDADGSTYIKTWALLTDNKLVARVPGEATKICRFATDGRTKRLNYDDLGTTGVVLLDASTIGYHVVNKSGEIAVSTRVPRVATGVLSIPADLKSAHIMDDGRHYRYFTTLVDAAAYSLNPTDETAIEHNFITTYAELAALPSTEVYVGYQYDAANIPAGLPKLGTTSAATRYHVQINNKYWKASDVSWHDRPNFGDGGNELVSANYQWIFFSDNEDPYDIRIKTPYWPDGYLHDKLDNRENGNTDGAYSTGHGMYLCKTSRHGHDEVHSFFFTNSDIGPVIGVATPPNKAGRQSYLYNHNNSYALLQCNTRGGDARQKVALTQLHLYRVVNKAGNIAVSAYMPATSPLTVPTGLRTPLLTADKYRFFTTLANAAAYNANPTDEEATAQGAITTVQSTGEIFIGYNYVNNLEVMDLSGERWYNIKGILAPNTTATSYYYYQNANSDDFYAQSTKEDNAKYMFQFTGNDPYDITIYNGQLYNGNKQVLTREKRNDWYYAVIQQRGRSDFPALSFMMLEHEDGYTTLAVHNKWYVNGNFNLGTAGDDAYIGMKFYMHYWSLHSNQLRMTNNDSYFYYYSDRNRNGAYATKLVFEPVKYTTTFHIIDNAGREAIKYTGEFPANMPIDYAHLPQSIRSPYLIDETITAYSTATDNGTSTDGRTIWNLSNVIATTPATSGAEIYIRYTTDHLTEKPFGLTGNRQFNVRIDGNYIYLDSDNESLKQTDDDTNKLNASYNWHLSGNDPYAMTLWNQQTGNTTFLQYSTTDGSLKVNGAAGAANTYFIAMRNNAGAYYEVMAATCDDAAENYYNIGRVGDDVKLYSKSDNPQGNAALQMQLSTNQTRAHYYIIDKQNKIVIDAIDDNVELQVPASIASPLVGTYRFYKPYSLANQDEPSSEKTWFYTKPAGDEIVVSDDQTYIKEGESARIYSVTDAPKRVEGGENVHQVFVEYDANDLIQFNGRDKGTNGKMYMLKFYNGERFYQEDGLDGVTYLTTGKGDKTKAVYPYSNGDANLYIYGEEQWTTQLGNAATTRTRWPWYIVSENEDPYHVKIQSRQGQNSDYNYFRTYQPQGYNKIVTGVITGSNTSAKNYVEKQQTGETNEEFTARKARQIPTEYMVLGTNGHFKLTTTKPVALDLNNDGDTEDEGENERRTVNSFEQYWKTYDTVKKNIFHNKKDDDDADDSRLTVPDTARTKLMVEPYKWHAYKAWANAKRWDGKNGVTNKTEKGYEYTEHWFQTIEMGEEFDFVEIEIMPALILLDNHGWEIMRKPLPTSSTDPERLAKYAAIKPYDSPMVKNYYFWKKGSKIPYYHRFNVSELCYIGDDPFTSTTLTSLPPFEMARDADGRLIDWYVTYEVKEEYASTYKSPQTVDGEAQTAAFLIHQGSQYAMMNNGGTTVVGTTKPDDAIADNDGTLITDAMKWLMMPNLNIDKEMGYIYAGEPGASPDSETKEDLLSQYLDPDNYNAHHLNGFDPYNLQLKNLAYGKYFKVNGNGAALDGKGGMRGTYSTTPGQLSLNADNTSVVYTAEGYDHSTIRATNTTFMAVDDGNGNIRLMPRFDHTNVITNFTTVETQMSAAPANDHNGSQTTTFMLPTSYEYIIVDNQGQESLRYKGTFGEVRPSIPTYMASPLAKDFKFYKELAYNNETHICTDVAAGTDISAKEITGSFGEAGLTSTTTTNMVYVRYSYNEAGDKDKLLSEGDWHTVAIDGMSIKVDWDANSAAMVIGTLPDISNYNERKYWECKFIRNALTESPDPYNVSGFNRARPNDRWAYRFALLPHGDEVALAVAGFSADDVGKTGPYDYVFLSSKDKETTPVVLFQKEIYFDGSQTTTETIGEETVTVKIPAGTFDGTVSQVTFGDAAEAVVQYYVITNDGHLALKAKEPAARAKGEPARPAAILPPWARSPLLNKEDFVYYTNANFNSETDTYTIASDDRTESLLGLPGEVVYVRYNYNLETTPYTVKDTYFTNEVAPRYLPLDITGNTWYNIVTYSWGDDWLYAREKDDIIRGLDRPAQYQQFSTYPKENGNFLFQSTKPYLWRLTGSDPYAIKIVNGLKGNGVWFSAASTHEDESQLPILSSDENNEIQTFMLLKPVGSDIRLVATGHLNYFLSNTRWGSNWVSYYDAVDESKENPYQGVGCHAYEFFKAPVVRNYTFHAMNCDGATPVNTWTMMLRRDWLTQVKLQEDITRICAQYEQAGTHTFVDLDDAGRGRFYNAATMTDEDRIYDAGSVEYDVYPEIAEDETYHIWFKYKTQPELLAAYTSTLEQIASDVAYHNDNGRLDYQQHPGDAKWWFMVLDTDEDITATGEGNSRTFVGKQMFLRRENDGSVAWMNNDFALHKEREDNYKNYTYNRLAEWYRRGDNEAFREGRWLWAFVGSDPYLMKVLNFESAVGVEAESEGIYTLEGAANCFLTTEEVTQPDGTKNYPVTIPASEPTQNMLWGMAPGFGSEHTFSLMAPMTNDSHQALFWTMNSGTETDSVAGCVRANDRSNAIQLLRYVPVRYEDVNLVIRRNDEVTSYQTATAKNKPGILAGMKTGLSKLYFAASERMFAEGDKIDMSDEETLPLNVRRAFCTYTLYKDIFTTIGGNYTVIAGPYPTTTQATSTGAWKKSDGEYVKDSDGNYIYEPKDGDELFDEDGKPIMVYTEDGTMRSTPVETGAQSIYASYEVTSDIFLKDHPTKDQVQTMANTNDHVFFMDFPDKTTVYQSKYDEGYHAYYHPTSTFRDQLGDLSKKRDVISGISRTEKKKWDGTAFVDDRVNGKPQYNNWQYQSAQNRMESVPEHLKWYFVGDPYKVQVYNVAGAWNTATLKDKNGDDIDGKEAGKVQANLCRFDDTETNFQFVVDCVHLRIPDYSNMDEEEYVYRTDEYGNMITDKPIHNRHYNQPYFNDFYWEVVPATSDDPEAFALRFKEDNDLLNYRNVYYYLSHDGLTKRYDVVDADPYSIDLSYEPDNKYHEGGDYSKWKGYHTANNKTTVVRLIQPVKVYVNAFKEKNENAPRSEWKTSETNGMASSGSRYTRKTQDELSEYYGLDEQITAVPRHLQRKFVKYGTMNYTLAEDRVYGGTLTPCTAHASNVFVTGTNINHIFKFNVSYKMDDLTKNVDGDDVHLFTPLANYESNPKKLEWVDMAIANTNWFYFDKTQNDKTQVSNYRTAVGDDKADGWNDGLKGLHWALVGDPYDFTILNRRRYEDGNNAEYEWMTVKKVSPAIKDYTDTNDSVIWTTNLATATDARTSSTDIADAETATHFSVQMWKAGNDNQYFLRTASLKTGADDTNNASGTNQTNNYWRMVSKPYPNSNSATSYFEMVPFSLGDMSNYVTGNDNLYTYNYSQTMGNLGVLQQRLEIRTAVAKDEDDADNNSFDAYVEIRDKNGNLKLVKDKIELRYGDVLKSLPYSLRRYGCTYKAYINWDEAANNGMEFTLFPELATDSTQTALDNFNAATKVTGDDDKQRRKITYIYDYDDEVGLEQYFTTEQSSETDDYTWMNTYFYWLQQYYGARVEVEKTRLVFDHYVYNSSGHIIDEVYREESYVEIVNNPTEPYPTKGYLNTHNSQEPVYADETTQTDNDRQKWSLVGDPYGFTMKNYAQYLVNDDATVVLNGDNVVTQNGNGQQFAYAVDKFGNPYLAVIDATGNITELVDFEFSSTSDKSLYQADGSGVNTKDPTGNTLATTYKLNGKDTNVKPFYLASLVKYADVVVYHLVMAHQHSLDYADTGLTEEQQSGYSESDTPTGVNARLVEFLRYWEKKNNVPAGTYIPTAQGVVNSGYQTVTNATTVNELLKKQGTLRDFLSYPVPDQEVSRIGIGNRPQVPWYMKRQFCQYTMYQKDIQRSVTTEEQATNSEGQKIWQKKEDDGTTTLYYGDTPPAGYTEAYNVKWVSLFDVSYWSDWDVGDDEYIVTAEDVTKYSGTGHTINAGDKKKMPNGYTQGLGLQGQVLTKLEDCHHNRKVIVDVVYEVNPNKFRFADKGQNTTAWYQMMTNNDVDGLMNFSYLHGIGARQDKAHHYTNDYLWAPEGDPYGFVLRSRYATINGTGWDNVAVTTKGQLPKENYKERDGSDIAEGLKAKYTDETQFNDKRIIHLLKEGSGPATTDGPSNAVYEMFNGGYNDSFLMHPTSAWTSTDDASFKSYYMTHTTAGNTTQLELKSRDELMNDKDANWRLQCTPEQLLPYFNRAGFVGGLKPTVASDYTNETLYNTLQSYRDDLTLDREYSVMKQAQDLVYSGTFSGSLFSSTNLVNMEQGYYRILGFSKEKLQAAEGSGGIHGPRYVSGYRFLSEKTNNMPLRFFETTMEDATIHTFADLDTKTPFTAETPIQGNVELLPADFDPSSIFYFKGSNGNYILGTQGLEYNGDNNKLTDSGTSLFVEDIGGTAFTMRKAQAYITTNYLTSNGDSYSLSIIVNNELNETATTDIQDTKWLLQPVGIHEDWPYNEMPLRVEVKKGGVKDQTLEGVLLTAEENKDPYYYGSLYVPFDSRLATTTDGAFTMTTAPTASTGSVTMKSVSQLNNMSNPQYVPAAWPVVLRTNVPKNIELKNQDKTNYATRYYVNMYLPNDFPSTLDYTSSAVGGKLEGKYLEQDISSEATGTTVMVFGLPFIDHTLEHSDANTAHHEYNTKKHVGWYKNDNWNRETYYNYKAHDDSYPSTATVATDVERSNTYVYNNKVYYLYAVSSPAPRHIIAWFDDEPEDDEQQEMVTEKNVPWPCDVYDLQGRKVASQETPSTLLRNNPSLRKGVYIFGGRKVVVR